jgi:hydroxyacylglutathione hydrolase
MLRIETLTVGPLETNCYLFAPVSPTGEVVIVDPGAEPEAILDAVSRLELKVAAILLTHGHVDHMAAAAAVRDATGAPVHMHVADAGMVRKPDPYWASLVGGVEPCEVDVELTGDEQLHLAGVDLQVIHTPGHSPGSICYMVGGTLFSGDTLFAGSIGRTDLPGGDDRVMQASLARLTAEVTGETRVLPGHGPETTMQAECQANPFLQDLPAR